MRLSRDLSSTPRRSVTGGLRVLRRPGRLPRCSRRARGRAARRACPARGGGSARARGESNSGSVASPQASVSSSAAASCSAAAIPQGPSSVLDRNTSIPAARASRISSRAGLKPPAPATFTFTTSHASSSAARRSSRSVETDSSAAIAVDTRWRTSASSRSVRHGCSTSSRSFPSMPRIACTASSTDQAPLASTRKRRPRPDRLAHGRHALDVVGQADLQLEAGVAVAQAGARALGHLLGRPGRRASCSPAASPCAARRAGAPPGARAGRAGRSPRRRAPAAAGARRRP